MSGIGGQEQKGRVITLQVPLPDTVDGVVDAVRDIILKGSILTVSIKNGEPIVYERFIPAGAEVSPAESTSGVAELGILDVLRNIEMEEFDEAEYQMEGVDAGTRLMWMYLMLESQGYSATHLVVSPDTDFWPWVGLARAVGRGLERFMGAKVVQEKGIAKDVFLLCGAAHRGATIAELKFSFKGNIPGAEDEGTDQESD